MQVALYVSGALAKRFGIHGQDSVLTLLRITATFKHDGPGRKMGSCVTQVAGPRQVTAFCVAWC